MSIYVPTSSEPQIRRLLFRNLSPIDVVVKLVCSKPQVVQLARARLRCAPDTYLFIEAKFMYSKLGTFDYSPPILYGYAMPVYTHNLAEITRWFNTPGMETASQLAFQMQVLFSNSVFSARDIVIDLPGKAALVCSVPRSIPVGESDLPVNDADADTKTAVTFTMQNDVLCNVREDSYERSLMGSDFINVEQEATPCGGS
ncbi:hypothetical protein Q1695_012905 [Nippostrongylus brasiliensis]|nr:hypothetical protein Q1695_012905 [Nippostrongylus brasiliensis]